MSGAISQNVDLKKWFMKRLCCASLLVSDFSLLFLSSGIVKLGGALASIGELDPHPPGTACVYISFGCRSPSVGGREAQWHTMMRQLVPRDQVLYQLWPLTFGTLPPPDWGLPGACSLLDKSPRYFSLLRLLNRYTERKTWSGKP